MRRKSSISPRIDGWPPLYLTRVPADDIRRGDGAEVVRRFEALCTVSKDGFAARGGDPLRLRGWQKQLLLRLFARRPDGRLRHRIALLGMPRKNGKSALGSGLALDGLLFGGRGAEVYSAAAEKDQARIVFGETKRMISAQPDLAEACNPMRDVIEVPASGSIFRCLSAEAYSKEGLNISRAIVDELHAHPTDELWNVLTLASAARLDPLIVAITTAGVMSGSDGQDSVCYRLFRYGLDIAEGRAEDDSFFMAWWGAPPGADHLDPKVWEAANPGFGDLIDPDDFASAVKRTPENEFRTKRLNQWVAAAQAWLPAGSWAKCEAKTRQIEPGCAVFLGFDGSFDNDSTALVAVSTGERPHIWPVELWERPADRGSAAVWRVPIADVEESILAACRKWQVIGIACDPFRWAKTYQFLEAQGLPVIEYPQSPQRMTPATQRFFEAVVNLSLSHDGDLTLARHVGNCVLKRDARGSRIVKESKGSPRRIDSAIAAVMAYDLAASYVPRKPRRPRVVSLAAALASAEERDPDVQP